MRRRGLARSQGTFRTIKTSIFSRCQRGWTLDGTHGGVGMTCGWGRGRVTKPPMFGQRGHSTEGLSTFVTLYLHSTIGMHPFVPAQVGKLGIGLQAYLTPKGFD